MSADEGSHPRRIHQGNRSIQRTTSSTAGNALALQPDGRIVIAGNTAGVNPNFAIARLSHKTPGQQLVRQPDAATTPPVSTTRGRILIAASTA
jgi:hypothetical protein